MKSTLRAKLLQHFLNKKKEGGFTLIELLVVIIIIGILAAIALPSFLNQANKAKQSEAKTYVGSMNRGQQAYYLENNTFATSIPLLGIGIQETTALYSYATTPINGVAVSQGWASNAVDNSLKGYVGGVKLQRVGTASNPEYTTLAVLCESLNPVAASVNASTPVASGGFGCDASTHKSIK